MKDIEQFFHAVLVNTVQGGVTFGATLELQY